MWRKNYILTNRESFYYSMSDLETHIKISLSSQSVSDMLIKFASVLQEQHGVKQKKWIDSREAMELLGISKNTLQKLRDNKAIRVSRPPDIDKFFYDRDSILDYLDKHATHPK